MRAVALIDGMLYGEIVFLGGLNLGYGDDRR